MTDIPPNGKGITTQEWVRDILAWLVRIIDANDVRYTERWKAQEQAITKQESAQSQYNIQHNGLLADNRKQSEEINRRFETVVTVRDLDTRLSALSDRLTKLENTVDSHGTLFSQIPINTNRLSRLEEIQQQETGATKVRSETKSDTRWNFQQVVTILFGIVGIIFGIIGIIERLPK